MKYHIQRRRVAINPNKLPCSSVWAAMKRGMDTFQKVCRWTVGRNSSLNFWFDHWLTGGPLRQLIQGPLTQEASLLEVKDILVDSGWDWGKIPFELPEFSNG